MPAMFGIGAVIILPFFYAALGFVFSFIMAVLYNIAATLVGGIGVTLTDD